MRRRTITINWTELNKLSTIPWNLFKTVSNLVLHGAMHIKSKNQEIPCTWFLEWQPCHSPVMVFCSSRAIYLGFFQCPLWVKLVFLSPISNYFKMGLGMAQLYILTYLGGIGFYRTGTEGQIRTAESGRPKK